MKLILFDNDGILLQSGSVKFDYWKAIVKKHFGLETYRNDVYTEGKTDKAILAEHLKSKGIKEPEKDLRFLPALKDIGNIVEEAIKDQWLEKVPNVEEFIKRLIQEKHAVGLLTGNTYEKAKVKLENANLWKYFKAGAFGDATKKRSKLVEIAIKDAKQKIGINFEKENVYIVGDTVRDIQCAKEAGVKIIAVATGKETVEQLEKEKPDYLFRDFSDIEKIMEAIK